MIEVETIYLRSRFIRMKKLIDKNSNYTEQLIKILNKDSADLEISKEN
jgi:hypothetical protein